MKKKLIPALIVVLIVLVTSLFFVSRKMGETESPGASICVDQCGNGTCEEMVCMGEACPCAETAESCPRDCAAGR